MVLIGYDGSTDAKAAIEQASELLGSQPAMVLTVWQPFAELLARTPLGLGLAPGVLNIEEADEASRAAAERLVLRYAQRLGGGGLRSARIGPSRNGGDHVEVGDEADRPGAPVVGDGDRVNSIGRHDLGDVGEGRV